VKHLQGLENAGLVRSERVGREVRFRAEPAPLASAVGWLLDAGASWDRRIDRLRSSTARGAGSVVVAN
jgi:DNA-binding transcriptional ArsR family regulator